MSYIVSSGQVSSGVSVSNNSMTVLNGGTAMNCYISSSGHVYISSGGVAANMRVSSGGEMCVLSGGTAADTTIDSDGYLHVLSGGTEMATIVNYRGNLYVSSGGIAMDTTVNWGGWLVVLSGGTATGVVVSSGAFLVLTVTPDTYAQGTSDGSAFEMKNGCLSGYVVNCGSLLISSGCTATSTIVNPHGGMGIVSGGTAMSTTVNPHGGMHVASGGTALQIKENGGWVSVDDGAEVSFVANVFRGSILRHGQGATIHSGTTAMDTTVSSGCCLHVSNGGTAMKTAIAAKGSMYVSSGGTATETQLFWYGNLYVLSGGTATSTIVNTGGDLHVSNGGTATETVINGGYMYVSSGGTIAGSLQVYVYVGVAQGAIIDFTVAEQSAPSTALINNWSLISNGASANYTITVRASQAAGTYALADGAANFNQTITLKNTFDTELGMLAVGQTQTFGNRTYTLAKNDASLMLTIQNGTPIRTATITVGSEGKVYDGKALTADYDCTGLLDGDTLTATVNSLTDAGSVASTITDYAIMRGEVDVTGEYGVTIVNGNLTVTPRDLTLTSDSATKVYDGTALTAENVTVDGFVDGEGVTCTVTGSQTEVGTSKNTFTYAFDENTKASNYNVTVVEGDLTVTPASRFIVTNGETLAITGNYSCPAYAGNGGAGEVQLGGTLTGNTVTFFGNTALSTRSADSCGGAVINAGTATFDGLNGYENCACYGGAFANSGTLTVKNDVSFERNVAEDSGGAIFNQGTCILVDGGTFACNGASYIGGAICNKGEFSVGDVLFDGNTATQKGGAIYTEDKVLFTGTALFVNNYSQSGGAIYSTGNISLTGGTFCGNGAYGHGGAIFNSGTMSLQNVNFSRNLNLSDTLSSGAAIYNTGVITVSNADFTGNSSSRGGAVCNAGGTFTLTDAVFRGNGGDWSGAICNTDGGTFTLVNVIFDANDASRMGGAISNSYDCTINMIGGTICDNNEGVSNYGTALFTNVLFADNHSGDLIFGACIYNQGYAAVNGGTFCGNSGAYGAGFRNYGSMWVANSLFFGNIGGTGAGLCNDGSVELVSDTFCNNQATGYGGAIHNNRSISMTGCLLQENQATCGGAICNIESGLAINDAVVFCKNSATQGGAIYNQYQGMTISGATFSENTAVNEGGAIYAISGSVTISDTTFSENNSSNKGGAIYTKTGTFTLTDVTFDNNRAPQQQGGAIYNEAGTITLAGSVSLLTFRDTIYNGGTFNWSVAGDAAGYLNDYTLLENDGKLCITVDQDIAGSKILAGNAVSAAGETFTLKGISGEASITVGGESVVYSGITFQLSVVDESLVLESDKEYDRIVVKSGETESLTNATYHNSLIYARNGGAGEVQSGGTLTGERLLFTGNVISAKSEIGGGALYNAGMLTLRNATFDQNGVTAQMATVKSYATGKGGAIFNDGGSAELTDVVFSANTVSGGNAYGGAIYNQSGTVTLTNAEFTGNMGFYGGALYNKDGVATATGATFCNNSGYGYSFSSDPQGGAIYNQSGTVTLEDVVFIGNTTSYCGALFNSGVVNVTGGTFCGNTGYRYDSCGAIYNNKTLTLSDVTFGGNYGARGGAIGNYGTLNLTGKVQLLTASDTIYNGGTINWDLTNGDAAYLDNFALLNNSGTLSITVNAYQAVGNYTIATGDLTDISGKDTFLLTLDDTSYSNTLVANGAVITYQGRQYQLGVYSTSLILTVSEIGRFVVTNGKSMVLGTGTTYNCPAYAGNGGAGEVQAGGVLTATGEVSFVGNAATQVDGVFSGNGGAIMNIGTAQLAAATYKYNSAVNGGGFVNCSTFSYTGVTNFISNAATQFGGAFYNGNWITFGDYASFTQNYAASAGGAVCNDGHISFSGVNFTNNFAQNGGGAIYNNGSIDFGGNVLFSGNASAAGGAIYNTNLIRFAGSITLETTSDSWVNQGGTTVAITNWDLRNAPVGNAVCINNYQYFSNVGDKTAQTITVNADQALGNYTIATGDLSDLNGKNTFFLTLDDTSYSSALVAGGASVTYQGRQYQLGVYSTSLILTVSDGGRFVATSTNPVTLEAGKTYTYPAYAGNGGAGEVQPEGTLTASGEVSFVGNAATQVAGIFSGYGGAVMNISTAQLDAATYQYNSAVNGGGFANCSAFSYTGVTSFISNAATQFGGGFYNGNWITFGDYASFTQNYAASAGGAVCNDGQLTFSGVNFTNNCAQYGGGAIYNNGSINFSGNALFSGNASAAGGAIYNTNLIRLAGSITLETTSDTWVNQGGTTVAITNWDLRNAPAANAVCINNYQYFSNVGDKTCQTITVNADQAVGNYTIATGDLADLSGKNTFFLTLDDTGYSSALVANGAAVTYQGRLYQIGVDSTSLILTVSATPSLTMMSASAQGDAWDFCCAASDLDFEGTSFANDTLNIDTTALTDNWTLLAGDANCIADLESAASVTFGTSAAVWNGVAWSDGNFTLTTDDAKKTLLVSKLA